MAGTAASDTPPRALRRALFPALVGAGLILLALIVVQVVRSHPVPPAPAATPPPAPAVTAAPEANEKRIAPAAIDAALLLGRRYMVCSQRDSGNFVYEYNWLRQLPVPGDSQVRQAGSLWGLTVVHQARPSPQSALAIEKGLDFFARHGKTLDDGRVMLVYPGEESGRSGSMALLALAHIDYLRTLDKSGKRTRLLRDLDGYMHFLLSLRDGVGAFYSEYDYVDGKAHGKPSPYVDGEALLALVKAARYIEGYDLLQGLAKESAEIMYNYHVVEARAQVEDSDLTKGFYQWGSMAFYELSRSGWSHTDHYAERVIDLAHWMIDTHEVLDRRRNTAYAFEGIIHAWALARERGDVESQKKFADAIDKGLHRIMRMQVGGPFAGENEFLRAHPTTDPRALGGVMNGMGEPVLRIDVTQHQLHALILARRFLYR